AELRRRVLDAYGAHPVPPGLAPLHGHRRDALVQIGPLDEAPRASDVIAAAALARARGARELHVLGWTFGADAHASLATEAVPRVRLIRIPHEILTNARTELVFTDVPRARVELVACESAREASQRVRLVDVAFPEETAVPREVRPHLTEWSDWVDGWAVDWDYRGGPFACRWASHRAGRRRTIALESPAFRAPRDGEVRVKLIDVLGHETLIVAR